MPPAAQQFAPQPQWNPPPQPYQPPMPAPAPVKQATPPAVQQFEMQISHDDTSQQTTPPAPVPMQNTAPPTPMPPQPAPVAPWQPQQDQVSQIPSPGMAPEIPQPPIPAPQAPVVPPIPEPEPEIDDEEEPRHHELNIQPPASMKQTSTAPTTPQAPFSSPDLNSEGSDPAPVNPNQWFQPPGAIAPVLPAQPAQTTQPLFPSDTPLKSFSQQQEARNRRHGLMLLAMLVIALIILGGSALAYTILNNRKANDPQAAFNSMLSKSLATKQVHQSVVEGKTGTEVQVDYDVSDVAKPHILSTAHIGGGSSTTVMRYWSSFQDTFVQYQNTAGGTEPYLNKWIQARTKGVLQSDSEVTLAPSFEARRIFFGQMIFGNFPSSDRKSLESAFKDDIFSYDKAKVKTETQGDAKTFVYEVKIDTNKLLAYNQKVAKVVGVNPDDLNKESIQSVSAAMLYVDAATQHLVKVVTGDATITYSKYDSVTVRPQPASQMSWSSFLAATSNTPTSTGGSTTSTDTTSSPASTDQSSADSDASFDDPNFDDPLWSGDAGEN